jgi:hypothetical protein
LGQHVGTGQRDLFVLRRQHARHTDGAVIAALLSSGTVNALGASGQRKRFG